MTNTAGAFDLYSNDIVGSYKSTMNILVSIQRSLPCVITST